MKRLLLCLCLVAGPAAAQDLLIRHATVHTAGARGTLADTRVGSAGARGDRGEQEGQRQARDPKTERRERAQ